MNMFKAGMALFVRKGLVYSKSTEQYIITFHIDHNFTIQWYLPKMTLFYSFYSFHCSRDIIFVYLTRSTLFAIWGDAKHKQSNRTTVTYKIIIFIGFIKIHIITVIQYISLIINKPFKYKKLNMIVGLLWIKVCFISVS